MVGIPIKKPQPQNTDGEQILWKYQAGQAETDTAVDPTEYRCCIQEVKPPNVQQRVQIFHRRPRGSSSAVQLPITATLHAEHLTLFAVIIHHLPANVNRENIDIEKSIPGKG